MQPELCHCGKPLHYKDSTVRAMVEDMIKRLGPRIVVRTGGRAWLVPRHYIALHGLKAVDVPALGFEEISAAR